MDSLFWKNRNVLVTGGAGLVGSELISRLTEAGAIVSMIDLDRVGKSRIYLEHLDEKVNITYGDVTDYEFVERVVASCQPDTIFHLAARVSSGESGGSPLTTFDVNIRGTWNVLEAARVHRDCLRSVVVASSEKVNDINDSFAPLPYTASKFCSDLIARSYHRAYNLPVSIVRCSSLFGPGDLNIFHLIPGTIFSVLKGEPPIIKGDGSNIRGFLYVSDAVDGYLSVSRQAESTAGQVLDIAPDKRFSVLEIVDLIIQATNPNIKPVIKYGATKEVKERVVNLEKTRSLLGWRAETDIKKALGDTVSWYRANFFPKTTVPYVHVKDEKSKIPVVIFVGGLGSRLREETYNKPKPMVEVGGFPLLWHVMKIYAHYGFRRVILTLGYRGEYIREYLAGEKGRCFNDFDIDLVETGRDTPTGGRLLRVADHLNSDTFMVTYGDGVSNVNIDELYLFHQKQRNSGVVGTVTGIHLNHRFGIIEVADDNKLVSYKKEHPMKETVNGGFMVMEKGYLAYLADDQFVEEPFNKLASQGKLAVYDHRGYWGAVDTYKDLEILNDMWQNSPKWKVWSD